MNDLLSLIIALALSSLRIINSSLKEVFFTDDEVEMSYGMQGDLWE